MFRSRHASIDKDTGTRVMVRATADGARWYHVAMSRSAKEIEIKLPFASAAEARRELERSGAHETAPRCFEDNRLFDRRDGSLRAADKVLRLREIGDRSVLTFKEPVAGEHRHKVRIEYETDLDDPRALEKILSGVDFVPSFRYQKYRTQFARGDLDISLDETPLGCFVELEGPPESIDRLAFELGFGPGDYVRDSYMDLHQIRARERGTVPGDLLLDASDRR
jgi:adenylate cyclase class 2